ncbi:MAG: hypothetical protein WCD70_15695 [Alphaproteobacteria bacterium]
MSDKTSSRYNLGSFVQRYLHEAQKEITSCSDPAIARSTLMDFYRQACAELGQKSLYDTQFYAGQQNDSAKGDRMVFKAAEHNFAAAVLDPGNSRTVAMHELRRQRYEHMLLG